MEPPFGAPGLPRLPSTTWAIVSLSVFCTAIGNSCGCAKTAGITHIGERHGGGPRERDFPRTPLIYNVAMDVVEILVGYDPFQAQAIKDHCADQGVHGEVLLYDETRYELGAAGRVENRFVCAAEDESAVRLVIAALFPDLVFGASTDDFTPPSTRSRPLVRAAALVLALVFVGPLLAGAVRLVADLLAL